jgi:hypothetical protein
VLTLITAFLAAIGVITSLEVLALRQQIAVLKRRWPEPSLNRFDRLFWITMRRIRPQTPTLCRNELPNAKSWPNETRLG